MATIIRDPLVEDYLVEMDVGTSADIDAVRSNYERGKLILLRGVRYDIDFAFLNSINFDVDAPAEIKRKMKKFGGDKIAAMDPSSTAPLDRFVFGNVFKSDTGLLAYYKSQVNSCNAQADKLYNTIFPRYEAYRTMHSWRFTQTMYENLHWDNFGVDEVFQQVRIFTNISRSPRLWRVSHRITDYVASVYDRLNLSAFADRSGDDLNRFLNNVPLGGMKAPCLDRLPKHHIAFEQGEIWLCETRLVSHQIYHGERAFAAMYYSDPASMDNPALGFDHRISQLHAARRETASA